MSIRLPRLTQASIVGKDGHPAQAFRAWWQSVVKALEGAITDIEAVNDTQTQMLADIQTALTNAGIALSTAKARMGDIPPATVLADYTGAVLDGQLPRNIAATRYDGDTDVTTSATWSATLSSGDATFTIGAATGVLNLTALGSSSVISITSEHNDISLSRLVAISKVLGDPPPSSGAGTDSAYDNSITSTSSDAYGSANAGPLTLTCGASGEVSLAAPLDFVAAEEAPPGSFHCYGKWQWRVPAGVWADVATEIQSSSAADVIDGGDGFGPFFASEGTISVAMTKTGLTPGDDYEFQLLLRNDTGSARTLYYTGSASAVTS